MRPPPTTQLGPHATIGDVRPFARLGSWLAGRLFPLLATIGLIVIGVGSTLWWGPRLAGQASWILPDDLWGTLLAAQRMLHLDLGGLYTQPTGLVSFPGAPLILVPVVTVLDSAGISLQLQSAHNPEPAAWLLAGPYQVAASAIVLFAAERIARRLAVSWPKRLLLATAEAVALWNVSVRWGHPEDAVAVGLLLYAIDSLATSGPAEPGWVSGRQAGAVSRSAWLAARRSRCSRSCCSRFPSCSRRSRPGGSPGTAPGPPRRARSCSPSPSRRTGPPSITR